MCTQRLRSDDLVPVGRTRRVHNAPIYLAEMVYSDSRAGENRGRLEARKKEDMLGITNRTVPLP